MMMLYIIDETPRGVMHYTLWSRKDLQHEEVRDLNFLFIVSVLYSLDIYRLLISLIDG